ncbi:hypothetical protein [Ekhidna sp.]|jgi:hypothetical protein|uniref:hypothetical protein n=1 Tax=Ekhidna sp. TaxID=2608089 RepID=UPI0032EAECBD
MQKLFWVLLLVPFLSLSQEMDTVVMDTAAIDTVETEPPPYYLGIYAIGGVSFEPSSPDYNLVSMLGGGVQYERWSLDFTIHDFKGTVQTFVVFPNVFDLNYRYGGPRVSYRFFDNDKVGLWINAGYYKGDMTWKNVEDGQDFLRDEFSMIKFGVVGEFLKLRYIKPCIAIGYQKMQDLNLSSVSEDSFSGAYIRLGGRIGFFNQ